MFKAIWNFLRRFGPIRAFLDLRRYLASRAKHELLFLFASMAVCVLIIAWFVVGSRVAKPYQPPTIIYVQSWPADRTDAEIIAQQKIDQAKKKIDDAKLEKLKAERRAEFKRLGDRLKPWL